MQFKVAERNINFDTVRYRSDNGLWEIGVRKVLYGYRVCGMSDNAFCYAFDYCAGDNRVFAVTLLATMMVILNGEPNTLTARELEQKLPLYKIRPIDKDPSCWLALQMLAVRAYQKMNPDIDMTKHNIQLIPLTPDLN